MAFNHALDIRVANADGKGNQDFSIVTLWDKQDIALGLLSAVVGLVGLTIAVFSTIRSANKKVNIELKAGGRSIKVSNINSANVADVISIVSNSLELKDRLNTSAEENGKK